MAQWQWVFFIAAGIYFVEALIFTLFATTEEQPWNRAVSSDDDESVETEAPGDSVESSLSFEASQKLGTK